MQSACSRTFRPSRGLALRRARARRRNAGAVLFIVAVTLGLLAVMGVYGLTATSADIKSAGHMREALQGQRAAEATIMMTAETFNPSKADGLVKLAQAGAGNGQSSGCRTANTYTGATGTAAAEACIKLDITEMTALAANVNPWVAAPFTSQSFGNVTNQAFVLVEVGNPVTIRGSGNSKEVSFTQVTATVFVDLKASAAVATETAIAGRGHITVGPTVNSSPLSAKY